MADTHGKAGAKSAERPFDTFGTDALEHFVHFRRHPRSRSTLKAGPQYAQ
jgi:hypothetical protein